MWEDEQRYHLCSRNLISADYAARALILQGESYPDDAMTELGVDLLSDKSSLTYEIVNIPLS